MFSVKPFEAVHKNLLTAVIIVVLVFGFAVISAGQALDTTATPPEPQYRDQYNTLQDGKLVPLERQEAMTENKSRRNFVITPNIKTIKSIPNPSSPIRVAPGANFYVWLAVGDRDPQTVVHLQKLTTSKKDRQILLSTVKQSLIPFGGVKQERGPDEGIAVTITKYGLNSLEVVPTSPLEPGEYAFMIGHQAQCFGVDPGQSSGSTPTHEGTARSPAVSQRNPPPPPPTHPASNVVDLPPGAPGYPPLHASAAAPDGCWWTPYVSAGLGLEMLVQQCEPGKAPGGELASFGDTAQGIASISPKSHSITELFTVQNKPAAQPITVAIQKQFISKLPVLAARTSCKLVRDPKDAGPGETYTVEATGPYSRLKKFNTEEIPDEYPCPGVGSDDVVGRSFLYLPAESQTKYIFFQIQEQWPFDQSSIHFLPEKQNGAS